MGEAMEILQSFLTGLGLMFLQPLFYLFLLFAALYALQRVWQERKTFNVRLYSMTDEWVAMLKPALVMGIFGSIVVLALGLVLRLGMRLLIAAAYVISLLCFDGRLMS